MVSSTYLPMISVFTTLSFPMLWAMLEIYGSTGRYDSALSTIRPLAYMYVLPSICTSASHIQTSRSVSQLLTNSQPPTNFHSSLLRNGSPPKEGASGEMARPSPRCARHGNDLASSPASPRCRTKCQSQEKGIGHPPHHVKSRSNESATAAIGQIARQPTDRNPAPDHARPPSPKQLTTPRNRPQT
jgi:hypothetical protein